MRRSSAGDCSKTDVILFKNTFRSITRADERASDYFEEAGVQAPLPVSLEFRRRDVALDRQVIHRRALSLPCSEPPVGGVGLNCYRCYDVVLFYCDYHADLRC